MNNLIEFIKMQALSNDFMVVINLEKKYLFDSTKTKKITQWAHRKTGIGFDQLLLIEPATGENCDFYFRIFNADGHEVTQCGNGARAVGLLLNKLQLATGPIRLQTHQNVVVIREVKENRVAVELAIPKFSPIDIPMQFPDIKKIYEYSFATPSENKVFYFRAVNVGNPHAVFILQENSSLMTQKTWQEKLGIQLNEDSLFPEKVNVGFMNIKNAEHIELQVYERGVGMTDACGSGATAAVIAGILAGKLNSKVKVTMPGGDCHVEWLGENTPVILIGSAEIVFEGKIAFS